jgi:hypothetical protein
MTFNGRFRSGFDELRRMLLNEAVTHVAMEANAIHWRPVFFAFECRLSSTASGPVTTRSAPTARSAGAPTEAFATRTRVPRASEPAPEALNFLHDQQHRPTGSAQMRRASIAFARQHRAEGARPYGEVCLSGVGPDLGGATEERAQHLPGLSAARFTADPK